MMNANPQFGTLRFFAYYVYSPAYLCCSTNETGHQVCNNKVIYLSS